ncbi:MAG: patatin-like phospholipase family protein [Sulfobacillus sp.]
MPTFLNTIAKSLIAITDMFSFHFSLDGTPSSRVAPTSAPNKNHTDRDQTAPNLPGRDGGLNFARKVMESYQSLAEIAPDLPTKKKRLHLVLPGGGIRGAAQAGFLYSLEEYSDFYEVVRIDGVSAGAINGYAVACGRRELLRDFWLSIDGMHRVFPPVCGGLFSQMRTLLNGFSRKGLFHNGGLQRMLADCSPSGDPGRLERFNCVVTDLQRGEPTYINGTSPELREYVLASASPWIVVPPQEIGGRLFTDGGLLENFPLKYVGSIEADIVLIVGYDPIYEDLPFKTGDNIFTLVQGIIDVARRKHYQEVTQTVLSHPEWVRIPNVIQTDFLNFDQEIIKQGFLLGQNQAREFCRKYFLPQLGLELGRSAGSLADSRVSPDLNPTASGLVGDL